jgi:hypothetical protein
MGAFTLFFPVCLQCSDQNLSENPLAVFEYLHGKDTGNFKLQAFYAIFFTKPYT